MRRSLAASLLFALLAGCTASEEATESFPGSGFVEVPSILGQTVDYAAGYLSVIDLDIAVDDGTDGDAVIITVIADNLVCAVACAAGETEYFMVKETGSAVAVKLYTTRSVDALGVVTYSGLKNVTTAGTGTVGKLELGDADGVLVVNGDEYMEVMINDAANNRFIVERQSTTADFDYHAFTYDSGDQFNVYADTVANVDSGATAAKTAASMGHLPQSGEHGMLAWLGRFPDTRRVLIHINNTNPILDPDSPERATVERAGVEVAFDGMEIPL